MTAVVVACEIIKNEVEAARKKTGTDYQIIYIDGGLHINPEALRRELEKKLKELPPEVDTVLLAMALCGNAIVGFKCPQRVVVPRMDDCLTMFLHQDDRRFANLKEVGHMYLVDGYLQVKNFIKEQYDYIRGKYGQKRCDRVMKAMYKGYLSADVIETGTYDAHDKELLRLAQENADIMQCPLNYVAGSNIILEKLLAGKWDEQFMIAEKGQVMESLQFS